MAATGAQTFFGRIRPADLLGHSDIVASLGLISILMLMIIPLPPILLDLCLAANITIAILILIISLYTQRAMEFSIFPSLLLATTLFRLSLNVASTRLILLHGNEGMDAAGSVIQAFGQFVVGGSYVVGMASRVKRAATSAMRPARLGMTMKLMSTRMTKFTMPTT